jgi:hypothetical protein
MLGKHCLFPILSYLGFTPDVKALATWEVDSEGNATGVPASMYLMLGIFAGSKPFFFLIVLSSPYDKNHLAFFQLIFFLQIIIPVMIFFLKLTKVL